MFWEIWGLQKLFYEKLIYSQSRTKTSTKTHIAKQNKNTQIIACWYITYIRRNQKKSEKREIIFFVSWKVRPKAVILLVNTQKNTQLYKSPFSISANVFFFNTV